MEKSDQSAYTIKKHLLLEQESLYIVLFVFIISILVLGISFLLYFKVKIIFIWLAALFLIYKQEELTLGKLAWNAFTF